MVLYHKSNFFQLREKWLTRKKSEFAEPLFQNHVSTLFQNSGCRINGPLGKIISNALKYLSIESYIQAFLDLYLWNLKFRSKYINTLNNSLLATLWSSLPPLLTQCVCRMYSSLLISLQYTSTVQSNIAQSDHQHSYIYQHCIVIHYILKECHHMYR